MKTEFEKIISLCKAGVHLTVNQHKDYYETVEEHILHGRSSNPPVIEKEIFNEMVERDTIIELQAYPDTPLGFFTVYHYDVQKAMEAMLNVLEQR